jgi:hypothetical protein
MRGWGLPAFSLVNSSGPLAFALMHELLEEARQLRGDVVTLRRSIHREPSVTSNRYLLEEHAMITGQAMDAAVALEFLRSA